MIQLPAGPSHVLVPDIHGAAPVVLLGNGAGQLRGTDRGEMKRQNFNWQVGQTWNPGKFGEGDDVGRSALSWLLREELTWKCTQQIRSDRIPGDFPYIPTERDDGTKHRKAHIRMKRQNSNRSQTKAHTAKLRQEEKVNPTRRKKPNPEGKKELAFRYGKWLEKRDTEATAKKRKQAAHKRGRNKRNQAHLQARRQADTITWKNWIHKKSNIRKTNTLHQKTITNRHQDGYPDK